MKRELLEEQTFDAIDDALNNISRHYLYVRTKYYTEVINMLNKLTAYLDDKYDICILDVQKFKILVSETAMKIKIRTEDYTMNVAIKPITLARDTKMTTVSFRIDMTTQNYESSESGYKSTIDTTYYKLCE